MDGFVIFMFINYPFIIIAVKKIYYPKTNKTKHLDCNEQL